MKVNKKVPPYRDGYLTIVKRNDNKVSSFGAPANGRSPKDFTSVLVLAFDIMTIREKDQEFAQSLDKSLDLKVRTPHRSEVTTQMQVIIGSDLYDIYQVDPDLLNGRMYLYMQKVRRLTE